jgi:hypothetical protein
MSRPKLAWRAGDRKNKTKFPKGMVALQAQAQKFLMQLFSKSCDLRRFLKAAVRGGKSCN